MGPRSGATRAEFADSLRRAQSGDPAGFEDLVREYQSMVFSLAYHLAGSAPVAEDVAQEVFLELFRALPRIRSTEHLIFWLRRVATHRSIDRFRRTDPEHTMATLPERAAADEPEDVLLLGWLRRLILELPDNAKAVMVLRYQEDLEPSEIADVLDMPLNTVKSHLRRSLDAIRTRVRSQRRV